MKTMFGGNPAVEHFTAQLPFKNNFPSLKARREFNEKRKEDRRKLKEFGYKEQYFQFYTDNKRHEATAKRECEAFAKRWSAKTGIKLEVVRGFFM